MTIGWGNRLLYQRYRPYKRLLRTFFANLQSSLASNTTVGSSSLCKSACASKELVLGRFWTDNPDTDLRNLNTKVMDTYCLMGAGVAHTSVPSTRETITIRVLNTSLTRWHMRSKFESWPVFQMLNLRAKPGAYTRHKKQSAPSNHHNHHKKQKQRRTN